MDRTKKEHRSFLFPDQEGQWREPQITQDDEGNHYQIRPRCREIQTTEMSVSRAVSLSQTSSSQFMNNNNFYCSPTNDPVHDVVHLQMQDVSTPFHRFQDDKGYRNEDHCPDACHDGNNLWSAQPQVDHSASQMDIAPSGNAGFPANSWSQIYEPPKDHLHFAAYVADLRDNAALEIPNISERVIWNPAYSNVAPQGDHTQESGVPPLQQVSGDHCPHEVPMHFTLGLEEQHFHTVGTQNQHGSWPATTKLVSYPIMGYEAIFDNHLNAANSPLTTAAELAEPLKSQYALMSKYSWMPLTSLLLLPSSSSPHAEPNRVANQVAFETSSDASLGSQQHVWDVSTGKSVPFKRKRSPSTEERAGSQVIRSLGGQCKKCKVGKRKCNTSHLQRGSEASTASPSARTCSDSEGSFVQVTTNNKRRKTTSLEPPPKVYSQSPQRLPGSAPGLPAVPEILSDIPSLDAAASTESHANSASGSDTTGPDIVDWGDLDFSQDNLCSGEQFSGAYGASQLARH